MTILGNLNSLVIIYIHDYSDGLSNILHIYYTDLGFSLTNILVNETFPQYGCFRSWYRSAIKLKIGQQNMHYIFPQICSISG